MNPAEHEILQGLMSSQKKIPSKFLYDKRGSQIFNQITELPEYYLTRCEKEIFKTKGKEISALIGDQAFHLIELGPGDGSKAEILINQLWHKKTSFDYYGVDISAEGLKVVQQKLHRSFPELRMSMVLKDYSLALQELSHSLPQKKVVLFLGSSIGNMSRGEAKKFVQDIAQSLNQGDLFIVGYDLKKDVSILERAYNDSAGLTSEFNLNLLDRLNREMDARFERKDFYHLEYYEPQLGAMVSYLVSRRDQTVQVGGRLISLKKGEKIHTEYSCKYDEKDIREMAQGSGLEVVRFLKDSKAYFTSVVFERMSEVKRDRTLPTVSL